MPQYLKYLAAVPYDVSDINISQGSVSTLLRGGGIFSYRFTANLLQNLNKVKEF